MGQYKLIYIHWTDKILEDVLFDSTLEQMALNFIHYALSGALLFSYRNSFHSSVSYFSLSLGCECSSVGCECSSVAKHGKQFTSQ